MRILAIFISLALSANTLFGQSKVVAEQEERQIVAGVEDIISLDFAPGQLGVGNPKLLKVEVRKELRQLRVFPRKKGTTSLSVSDRKGNVRLRILYSIITSDLSLKVAQIRQLLQDIEGIQITIVGNKIVIDGELIIPKDLGRIIQVQKAYQKDASILVLVKISKASLNAIARRIQKEIQSDPGGANVTVRLANDTFFLEGIVDNNADKIKAVQISRTFLPEILKNTAITDRVLSEVQERSAIVDLIQVEDPPPPPGKKMIRYTFHFVEMGKDYLKQHFFKWSPILSEESGILFGQANQGGIGATAGGSFAGTITSLIPRLQAASQGGFARILYSTVGIGLDGRDITISRNDNIPIIETINGTLSQTTQPVGINIVVSGPNIVQEDKVQMPIEFSFNALSGVGGGGSTATSTTQLKNVVIVRSGDSAVLGGLISHDVATDVDKDPEQAQAGNPLFTLLRSKAFRSKKTQFLVFVTPQIISDAAKGTEDIKKRIIGSGRRKTRQYR